MVMSWTVSFIPSEAVLPLLMTAVFAMAGLVKGLVGLGLPTVSMALLALMMTPAEAAALLVIPSLVTNLWQMGSWRTLPPLLSRLGPMQAGVFAGTLAGAWFLGAPAGAWATISLGAALAGYATWSLAARPWSITAAGESWLGPLVGAATGWVTAATGVFVIPAVPYLQALGLQPRELVRALGLSFTVSTVALGLGLLLNGRYPAAAVGTSALLLVPAIAGMAAGDRLRRKLSAQRFRQCLLASLFLLGAYLIAGEVRGA